MIRTRLRTVAAVLSLVLALGPGAGAAAARSSVSLTQLENQLMCVACHELLSVAQSPESFSERAYVRTLIAEGKTAPQIMSAMVAAYSSAVLAVPPAHGFNLLVYIIPALVVLAGLATLAYFVPRWRRRGRQARTADRPPPLDPADAQRLDAELARNL